MIVRILGEGQYDVSDDALNALNELDAKVESSIETGDEAGFTTALAALLDGVRSAGVAHDVGSLDTSDLILPMADASLAEVRDLLSGDGLIPG
ncbi:MAG: PspA-associated protein PspAA [Nocardioides sp.]